MNKSQLFALLTFVASCVIINASENKIISRDRIANTQNKTQSKSLITSVKKEYTYISSENIMICLALRCKGDQITPQIKLLIHDQLDTCITRANLQIARNIPNYYSLQSYASSLISHFITTKDTDKEKTAIESTTYRIHTSYEDPENGFAGSCGEPCLELYYTYKDAILISHQEIAWLHDHLDDIIDKQFIKK